LFSEHYRALNKNTVYVYNYSPRELERMSFETRSIKEQCFDGFNYMEYFETYVLSYPLLEERAKLELKKTCPEINWEKELVKYMNPRKD